MSQSASDDAPLGIRTARTTEAGQLLCFYPGRVFEANETQLPKSDMLYSNEYEGIYIDGKGWFPAHWRKHPLLEKRASGANTLWHGNRLAVGNLLNHPPKGSFPNCVPMAFRWPTWQDLGEPTPAYWARLVPHVVINEGQVVRTASGRSESRNVSQKQSEGKVWFPPWPHMGVALVAVRSLQPGDELHWNYRLHPRADSKPGLARFPDWYEPVDDDAFEQIVADGALGKEKPVPA